MLLKFQHTKTELKAQQQLHHRSHEDWRLNHEYRRWWSVTPRPKLHSIWWYPRISCLSWAISGLWHWVWQGGQGQSSQQCGYLLLGSFYFYDFGCQVEPRRYFRALVDLPKTPPVDAKEKDGEAAHHSSAQKPLLVYSYQSKNSPVQSEQSRVASSMELLFLSAYEGLVLSFQPVVQCLH